MWLVATVLDRADTKHFHQNTGSSLSAAIDHFLSSLWPSWHRIELPVCPEWSDEWVFWIEGSEFILSHNPAGVQLETRPKYTESHPDTFQPYARAGKGQSDSISFSSKWRLKNNALVFVMNYTDLQGKKKTQNFWNPKGEYLRNRQLTNCGTTVWFLKIHFLALSKGRNQTQWRHNTPTWDSNDYQSVLSSEALQSTEVGTYHMEGFQDP